MEKAPSKFSDRGGINFFLCCVGFYLVFSKKYYNIKTCRYSSVAERILGKDEVDSPILFDGTEKTQLN